MQAGDFVAQWCINAVEDQCPKSTVILTVPSVVVSLLVIPSLGQSRQITGKDVGMLNEVDHFILVGMLDVTVLFHAIVLSHRDDVLLQGCQSLLDIPGWVQSRHVGEKLAVLWLVETSELSSVLSGSLFSKGGPTDIRDASHLKELFAIFFQESTHLWWGDVGSGRG